MTDEAQTDNVPDELQAENARTGIQTDLTHCPNCKMEVPKNIFCLNCGFPMFSEKSDEPRDVGYEQLSEPIKEEQLKQNVEADVYVKDEEELLQKLPEDNREKMDTPDSDTFEWDIKPVEKVGTAESTREFTHDIESTSREVDISGEEIGETTDIETLDSGSEEIELEKREKEYLPTVESSEVTVIDEPPTIESSDMESILETEPEFKKVMEEIVKSLSLKIWLVNLLEKGEIGEDHFNKLFEEYEQRLKSSINRRNEFLESARNLDSIVKTLNEAKISLAELKMKKEIGDISEDEYKIKAPAFQWDIGKYEDELSKRRRHIDYLENFSSILTPEEIDEIKGSAERSNKSLNDLVETNRISPRTAEKIKNSLQGTIDFLT